MSAALVVIGWLAMALYTFVLFDRKAKREGDFTGPELTWPVLVGWPLILAWLWLSPFFHRVNREAYRLVEFVQTKERPLVKSLFVFALGVVVGALLGHCVAPERPCVGPDCPCVEPAKDCCRPDEQMKGRCPCGTPCPCPGGTKHCPGCCIAEKSGTAENARGAK